ncbi:unnamed protein product [Symbiodinium microadriaticum]|nr:unnamed protein product [Symbiodinium microadriaticum]
MAKMMDRVQRQVMKEKLANFDLLKDLPLAAKEELMSVVEQVHYPKGSVLFYEGESSFDLFLILDGEVTVYKKSPSAEEQEQGAQPHAGGTQVGRTVPLDGVQRHAVGMQVACRWGAPCPPKKVQRHAVGHAGGARQPQQKNQPNLVDFSIADEFLGPCCGMKASQLQEQVHNRVQKTLQDPPITYDRKLSV